MGESAAKTFVIKAEELTLLSELPAGYPRPRRLEWINRGTDARLRATSVQMLLRTLFRDAARTPSVRRLHHSTGLRVIFATSEERMSFAQAFREARQRASTAKEHA